MMIRHFISLKLWLKAGCTIALLFSGSLWSAEYEQGVHYRKVPLQSAKEDSSKIQVVEIFSYACPHCYHFQPMVDHWRSRLPDDVNFSRMHAMFAPAWVRLAQAFHTAEELGVLEQIHIPMFEAIHEHHLDMSSPELLQRLFEQTSGISKETFDEHFSSFEAQRRIGVSAAALRVYRVMAVPSLVVDGTYLVSNEGLEGGNPEMLEVVDFLIDKIRREKREESNSPPDPADN